MDIKYEMLKSLLDADISGMRPEESKRLIDQLRNAISNTKEELQTIREERERIDKDMERWILNSDRLMPMAAKHAEALRAWDTERKRKLALSRQVEEPEVSLSSSCAPAEGGMKERRRRKASLEKEEKRLTALCSQSRQSLAEVQSRCLAAEEELRRLQDQVAMAASGQSQKSKEEQLVDEYVAKLDVAATVRYAGVTGRSAPRRGGRENHAAVSADSGSQQTSSKPRNNRKARK
ncbi:uncharacterized protein LOC118213968 [Anguilla anguilla]|uniref:uncharacterized protein LOC118213968 n=1 Tax=Anguilla anguilla TaxID=7936 RepID=UPI0015A94E23|nr:uncharacterized protein LOC118213968 [Anguilla anguilla]